MIDGSEKRNRQLPFELQNSHVCEKRSNIGIFGESHRNKKNVRPLLNLLVLFVPSKIIDISYEKV